MTRAFMPSEKYISIIFIYISTKNIFSNMSRFIGPGHASEQMA